MPFPCHTCAFFQFVCPAKARWRWGQQFVDDDEDDDGDDDDDKADTATAVGGNNNGGNSDGWGHIQQSTKICSKNTVAVTTTMETAAAGAAMTAAGMPMTAPGVGADGIAFATTWEVRGCWL